MHQEHNDMNEMDYVVLAGLGFFLVSIIINMRTES